MKKRHLFIPAVSAGLLFSCVNISDFREPYMQEVFMGSLSITPVVRGLHPGARSTSAVTIVGNKSGAAVSIFGLPQNDPFHVIPESILAPGVLPIPAVSGLEAEVVDRQTLKITGFTRTNRTADDLNLTVSGTLVRQGPRLSTKPDDPIIIRGQTKALQDVLSPIVKSGIVRTADKRPIAEVNDEETVDLYQVQFMGQLTSIF